MRYRALTALLSALAIVGVTAAKAATPTEVAHANRQAALSDANQVLNGLSLPAGTTEVGQEPAGDGHALARPVTQFYFAAQVDRRRFWTTSASIDTVIASITANLPAGTRVLAYGTSGSGESSVNVSYGLPAIDTAALRARQLVILAVSLSDGQTGMRADAEDQYRAPRPAAQRVPSQAGILDITMTDGSARPVLSRTVVNRKRVREIAEVVDDLPFTGDWSGLAVSCPAIIYPAPTDTFTFRAQPDGPALATVSESADTPTYADPCATTSLNIRGHREPRLMDGGVLLRRVDAMLGIKLTALPPQRRRA